MGKTKDVTINGDGTCTFKFKNDVTGENGVFDPGANTVGLTIDGMGKASMLLSRYFFPILRRAGVPTHDISFDIEAGTMRAYALEMLLVEFIWRAKTWGSFCKIYGVKQGLELPKIIEATLKSDALGDPRINREAAVAIGLLTVKQYAGCDKLTRLIGDVLQAEFAKFGYELIDFKVEFGVNERGEILLGDEISGGICRLLKDGKPVDPIDAARTICPKYYE